MADEERCILVLWSKQEYIINYGDETTVLDIRNYLYERTRVRPEHQKLMGIRIKGKMAPDSTFLSSLPLKKKQKVMLMGTAEEDIQVEPPVIDVEIIDDFDIGLEKDEVALEKNPIFLEKVQKRIKETDPKMLNEPRKGKPLLVLDIDYTIYDCGSTVEVPEEQMRPYLNEFLTEAYQHYDIAIWSATSMKWIDLKLKEIGLLKHPGYKITFCLDSAAMITALSEKHGVFGAKPLAVVWEHNQLSQFYSKENTIMFDDLRRNFCMNPKNGLRIRVWKIKYRDTENELEKLSQYLEAIKEVEDFTTLDHSEWEEFLKKDKKRKRKREKREEKREGKNEE